MSWMPAKDPVLGDKRSCDALDLIIVPRVRDLGDGFSVRRALPHSRRQMVGPFIFFDQMGPVQFVAGQGLDVRPHPISGLRPSPISSTAASCIATAKAMRSRLPRAR